MSSAVAELDAYLQSMLNLKPPGVSGSKVTGITQLCTANIQSESVLIQKIYTHFKKAPATHKLGVLYVVDSVTRQWVDQARKAGQQTGSGSSPPDGTFAAGVNRVTELLPVLMNDMIASAPEDQKSRIKKLLDIWERSSTFPATMIQQMREKLDTAAANPASTTPTGSPAPDVMQGVQHQTANPAASASQDTSAILAALKNMQTQVPAAPAASSLNNMLGAQNGNPSATFPVNQGSHGQAVNALGALFTGMSNGTPAHAAASVPPNPLAAFLPPPQPPVMPQNAPAPAAGIDVNQQFQLITLMAQQGIPPEQWGTALQLLNMQTAVPGGLASVPFPPPVPANAWPAPAVASRDQAAYTRSPPNAYRRRSRSPGFERRRDLSPRGRRDSPVYGDRNDRDGRRGNEYRQRSPAGRRRRSPTPPPTTTTTPALPPPGIKNVEFDPSLPKGTIRVLSRTLFVGGVTSSEAHLRSLFAPFGIVQTCIVNVDKRHAFVKMLYRKDAVLARAGMEEYKAGDTQLRTKWGVGFGPRDCSDYQTGISIIPIDRLTDADRKWMLTAEYGGTGGRPIESGMVVEEPDIEIGAGVSSKAMSRRIATDQGGKRGPQSSASGRNGSDHKDDHHRNDRRRDHDDRPSSRGNVNGNGNTHTIPTPTLPFQMPANFNFAQLPNGMPVLPGFPFQLPNMQQPPKQE